MKIIPGVDLFLSRFADSEWHGVVRPWLEEGRGRLERAIVVAPTRGQTHALKQRCVVEGVSLLGVEFLTPGLARKKRVQKEGLRRSLQLLVLQSRIEARLAPLDPGDPARRLWKSLASDLGSALDDFEDLARVGFRPADFPRAELRELFGELVAWVGRHGYALGPLEDEAAGLAPVAPGSEPVADRILILAGGPESWGDFFGLAALARRSRSVAVVLAEPEFGGAGGSGEEWVDAWQALLGVEARPIDRPDPEESCAPVAELWTGGAGSAERAEVIVARSKSDEGDHVADAVVRLLGEGADNIAVIFPGADAAHARIARLMEERGVPFTDLVGTAGTPPVDARIQSALVDFYGGGCRLEELLALWPLLRSLNLARLSPADARVACQELFDEVQAHCVEAHVGRLEASDDARWREMGRVARILLPGWPDHLTAADALGRFEAVRDQLMLAEPAGWPALREFARRAAEPMPARAILEAFRAFLPERGPVSAQGRGGFARVTLTTCRRAAGVAWSDAIFVEANTGVWPERREPSCWLGDETRRRLNESGRFSLGLPTSDGRAAQERRLCAAIARDTRRKVVLSAALFSEEDPEVRLGPNSWLERVMWSKGLLSADGAGTEAFERLAAARPAAGARRGLVPQPVEWFEIWSRRRDPDRPFDEFFLADASGARRPRRLSARQIESGVKDPAQLWFDAVLRVRRVEWRSFARNRGKSIGDAVHRVLAEALRGAPAEGDFFRLPGRDAAGARLAAALADLRAKWPRDRYWDSFHMDVCRAARELVGRVYELPAAPFGAVEAGLPEGATVPVGDAGRLAVSGRMDLVLSDRPGWNGARVEIIDYKTGGESKLSARRMASSGASLQLGVYLQAALSAGAAGSVWMLKPEERPMRIGQEEIDVACAKLGTLGAHLATGVYGALTPDRGEYTHGFEWPLACAPIGLAILESKFFRTFGSPAAGRSRDEDHG
ncbi:MAG TPA: PD-(D/E)XK nuclease family protein [Opitutaceae bacterium]|nr:PD-(D/E)XK nuclease family protein [Opitutaceae bacterium]